MFLRSGIGSLVNQIFPSAKGNVFAQNGIVPRQGRLHRQANNGFDGVGWP